MRSPNRTVARVLGWLGLGQRPLTPPRDLIWFQHFHKAGGTSLIEAARAAGWRPHRPNLNGNPVRADQSFIPLWEWDSTTLHAWLIKQRRAGVSLICCEFGFSKAAFDLPGLDIRQIAIMREPKARLISNYLFDFQKGHTRAESILDYAQSPPPFHSTGPQPFREPDYYTRRVTGESGAAARDEAFAWLSRYDHIAFLEHPESFAPLKRLIPGAGERHANRTDRDSDRLSAAYQSVLEHDRALTELVAGEQALYDRLRDHFA